MLNVARIFSYTQEDIDDNLRLKKLLKRILFVYAALGLVQVIGVALIDPVGLSRLVFSIVTSLMSLFLIAVVQRGYVRSVSWFLVCILWVMTSFSFVAGGGVSTAGYSIFLPVVLAIFLLGRHAGFAITGLTIIVGLVFTLVEIGTDWLPPPRIFEPLTYWISQSMVILLIALIIELARSSAQWALERAKSAESRWQALAQNTPDVIIEANTQNQVQFLNRTMVDVPLEAAIGQPVQSVVLPSLREPITELLNEAITAQRSCISIHNSLSSEGDAKYYQLSATPVFANQQLSVVSITIRDITTEIIAREQQIQIELEEEKNATLQTFIAEMSHDFKSPLASIIMSADLIMRYDDKAKQEQKASQIQKQALRLSNALQNLLTMAKLDHVTDFVEAPIHLNSVVEEAIKDFTPLIADKRLICKTDLEASLPPICGDRDQVRYALSNLVENAIRYSRSEGEIIIRTYSQGKANCIDVVDNGIGISPDEIDKIFQRYFRAANARSLDKTGTGLGLAIVQRIMETHSGKVVVNSIPEHGSTFTLTFPQCNQGQLLPHRRSNISQNHS